MTIFKTFWKIVWQNRIMVALYTVILVVFGGLNMMNNNSATDFSNAKPDVYIDCKDNGELAQNLVEYLRENGNVEEVSEERLDDAIFYRDVNIAVEIPEGYSAGVMAGENPAVVTKGTGDYYYSIGKMLLERYTKVQAVYATRYKTQGEVVEAVNANLATSAEVEQVSSLDTGKMSRLNRYYDFSSYSMMAVIIFVLCSVMGAFNAQMLKRRTQISSYQHEKYNLAIFGSSAIYSLAVWVLFTILGVVLIGAETVFSDRGLLMVLNSLVFSVLCLAIAILISNFVNNKEALNGVVNVVALGQAFLCGTFVPMEFLPEGLMTVSRFLPVYWFNTANDKIAKAEVLDGEVLGQVFGCMAVLVGFMVLFMIANNVVTRKKRRE